MILWCMSPSDLLPVYPITGYDCDEISLKIFMITVFLVEMISNVHNLTHSFREITYLIVEIQNISV